MQLVKVGEQFEQERKKRGTDKELRLTPAMCGKEWNYSPFHIAGWKKNGTGGTFTNKSFCILVMYAVRRLSSYHR